MGAASERLALVLEARTQGEQAIVAIEKQINSLIAAADRTEKASGQIQRTRDATAAAVESTKSYGAALTDFVSSPLSFAQGKFDQFTKTAGTFGIVMGAGTAAMIAGGTALFSYAKNLASSAEAAANLSAQTGLSVKEITLLTAAASNANVGTEGLLESYKGLSRALATTGDESKKARQALALIGVSPTNRYGGMESTYAMIQKIAGGLEAVQDPAKRAQRAIDILGEPGLKLLPLLTSNLAGTLQELDKLGAGLEDKAAAQALKFDASLDRLNTNTAILKKNLGELGSSKFDGAVQILAFLAAAANGKLDLNALGLKQPTNQPKNWADLPVARPDTINADGSPKYTAANTPPSEFIRQALQGNSDVLRNRGLLGPSTADLDATLQNSTRNRITALISLREGTEDRLKRAEKDLADAIAANNEKQVRETIALVDKLKEDLVNEQAVKRFMDGGSLTGVLNRVYPNLSLVYRGTGGQSARTGPTRLSAADIAATDLFANLNSPTDLLALQGGPRNPLPTGVGTYGAEQFKAVIADRLAAERQMTEFQARRIEMLTGPGGEAAAINRIADLRLQSLEREDEIEGQTEERKRARHQVELDRIQQLAELRQRALATGADQLFGLVSGQTPPGDFARNTALTIGRNAFNSVYSSSIGPKLGAFGKAAGTLAPYLSGTIFDSAQSGVDGNTSAVERNTAATEKLTMVLSTIHFGGDAGGGMVTLPGGIVLPTSVFNGSSGISPIFSAISPARQAPVLTGGEDDELRSMLGSRDWGKVIGGAGAIAGGGFGVYSGIKQGGARGAATIASAGAGAASTLMAVGAIAGGPVGAAIAAGAALGIEFVKSFLPDPKAARESGINRNIANAMYSGPGSGTYEEDLYGRQSYYDQGGRYIVVNVNTMDAKSFVDNRAAISDAVRQAMQESHPINSEIMGLSAA